MDKLSVRQKEVVALRCGQGLTQKEAAARLGIAEQSVKNHTTAILDTVGVHSMTTVCYRYGVRVGMGVNVTTEESP